MRAIRLAIVVALCASCGLREFGDPTPAPTAPTGWRVGLEPVGDQQRLTIRLRTRDGEVAAAADGVRLALDARPAVDLAFTSQVMEGESLRVRCEAGVADHSVAVRVTPTRHSVRVEVEDTVELPSTLAELSIEFRLLGSGNEAAPESFAPLDHPEADEVAGDVSWRTPLAYVRAASQALAILPDVSTQRPRILPGALELRPMAGARIRHGLVAQRVVVDAGRVTSHRDLARARRVAGQTVGFGHDLHLWANAQPRTTLAELARTAWNRLVMAHADIGGEGLAPQVERVLRAHPWSTARAPDALPTTMRFDCRQNALLLAAALATLDDPSARSTSLRLVRLAHGAPQRSGLSPTLVTVGDGRPTWSHANQFPTITDEVYDSTAVAWTRVCGLIATRALAADNRDRLAAERAAVRTASFLVANQRPNGAIPALYQATYLSPLQRVLYDPATETGAAALLLAECAALLGDDRAKWRQAAVAAVSYLQREVAPEREWNERATLLAKSGRRTLGTQNVTFAALAALRLLDASEHAGMRAAAIAFLEELTLQQQLWSPLWLAADPRRRRLIGGFGASDASPNWSDPVQALAGIAFLHGYEHLGRRDLVQRGAFALRAAMATTHDAEGDALSQLTAASICQLALSRWGSVIVDVGAGFVEPIEPLDVSLAPAAPGEIAFVARRSDQQERRTTAVFRGLPPSPTHVVIVNNAAPVAFTTAQLTAGIPITTVPVQATTFAPPTEIQIDRPFTPRLRVETPLPRGWTGKVEMRLADADPDSPPLADRDLEPDPDDPLTWRPRQTILPANHLRLGQVVRLRAHLHGPGVQRIDVIASNTTTAGTHTALDIAGLNEIDCRSADVCPRQLFVEGDRLARVAGDGANALVWELAVPQTALELELEVLLAGRLRLHANDSIVHEDTAETPAVPRRQRVTIADRRLWETGRLTMTFADAVPTADEPLQVAELRTRVTIDLGTPSEEVEPLTVTSPNRARAPDSHLTALVVPVALPDEPLTTSTVQMTTLFFGSAYRRTPGLQPRATTGSVREVLASITGGRTALVGEVAAEVRADFAAIDRNNPDSLGKLAALATKALAGHRRRFDVVVVVHSGRAPEGSSSVLLPRENDPPMIALAERAVDRSILPVGQVLAAILRARYGLEPRSAPPTGNFGALTLAGTAPDHLPAAPIGIDLAHLGWADVVEVENGDCEIVASAVQRERRIHRVLTDLPDRGELFLEVRGGLADEPGLPESGLLGYWRLPRAPLMRNRAGAIVRPSVLRLARGVTTIDTPFVPGAAGDLVRRAQVLDDVSDPSLATPEGELCFRIEDLAVIASPEIGERVGFRLQRLTRPLLKRPPTAHVLVTPTWTPLPVDGTDRGLGSVIVNDQGLALDAGRHRVRVSWPLASVGGRGNRLFARGRLERGPANLRIGYGETLILDRVFTDPGLPVELTIDLPPNASANPTVWLDVVGDPGRGTIVFDQLVATPRARADHAALHGGDPRSELLCDGVVYAPVFPLTTPMSGRVESTEPVLLPAGRAMLRLRCGFAQGAAPDAQASLDVRITSPDGKRRAVLLDGESLVRGEGEQPLLTALLDIGDNAEPSVAVLHLTLRATAGTTLWIVNAEIARQ